MAKSQRALEHLFSQSPWMASLSEELAQRVLRETVTRKIPAQGFVCRKGEAVNAWIGVVSGLVKISSVSAEGKAVTFTGVPSGGWFGEGSMLKDEPRRYDGIALRESQIAYLPKALFASLLDNSIAFNRYLLMQLNERLAQFIATVEHERLLGPEGRLAKIIAQLFNPVLYPGSRSELQISQAELGYLTGLSRQRANQALQNLERQGVLEIAYGAIRILDLEGLRNFEP
ncbi:MAG: Crp/Fnr family transcriptional regulator [Betaproteobacteria bacterium]|nr:Crp/Fnr family transcriptional regulator [Betaproteobacteria bacterium]